MKDTINSATEIVLILFSYKYYFRYQVLNIKSNVARYSYTAKEIKQFNNVHEINAHL